MEQFSPVPYLATLLQCLLWVVYGIPLVHPHSILVLTINAAGCVIEFTYVVLFLIYSDRKKRLKVFAMLFMETAFVVLVLVLVLTLAHTHERRSLIVGVLCVVFGTIMYVAPLSVMVSVLNITFFSPERHFDVVVVHACMARFSDEGLHSSAMTLISTIHSCTSPDPLRGPLLKKILTAKNIVPFCQSALQIT